MNERWLGNVTRDEYHTLLMVEEAAYLAREELRPLGARFEAEFRGKPPGLRPLDFVRWLERHGPPGMEVLCMNCDNRLLLVRINYEELIRHGLEDKGFPDFEARAMEAWNRNEQAHTCKQCGYTWPGLTAEQVEMLHEVVKVAARQEAREDVGRERLGPHPDAASVAGESGGSATTTFDMSPRRVWSGATIPGKKMMRMISSLSGASAGSELISLYEDESPHMAMFAAACALHELPEKGAIGPALRDLAKPLLPGAVYGAILTDIRDFLKLRFRASGLSEAEVGSRQAILEGLVAGRLPEGVEPMRPHLVVNYAISALDALSRDREGNTDFMTARRHLRNLLVATSKASNSRRGGFTDKTMDELLEQP